MDELKTRSDFTQELVRERILIPSTVRGLFGRGPRLGKIVSGIEHAIDAISKGDGAERVSFPPLIPRELLRKVGYIDNFPQLCGSVHTFVGNDREALALSDVVKAGGDWSPHLEPTELVLLPAACYPLYPTLTGSLPEGGARFELTGNCFRSEPSDDPARLQCFQMHEKVFAGTAEDAQTFRQQWKERGFELLRALGLNVHTNVATDPFFGRAGRLMKSNQAALELKYELLIPIFSESDPTACASFNYHEQHFGHVFDIKTAGGSTAHTACVGFGLDRIAIALLKTHGIDPARWPEDVRRRMWSTS